MKFVRKIIFIAMSCIFIWQEPVLAATSDFSFIFQKPADRQSVKVQVESAFRQDSDAEAGRGTSVINGKEKAGLYPEVKALSPDVAVPKGDSNIKPDLPKNNLNEKEKQADIVADLPDMADTAELLDVPKLPENTDLPEVPDIPDIPDIEDIPEM